MNNPATQAALLPPSVSESKDSKSVVPAKGSAAGAGAAGAAATGRTEGKGDAKSLAGASAAGSASAPAQDCVQLLVSALFGLIECIPPSPAADNTAAAASGADASGRRTCYALIALLGKPHMRLCSTCFIAIPLLLSASVRHENAAAERHVEKLWRAYAAAGRAHEDHESDQDGGPCALPSLLSSWPLV